GLGAAQDAHEPPVLEVEGDRTHGHVEEGGLPDHRRLGPGLLVVEVGSVLESGLPRKLVPRLSEVERPERVHGHVAFCRPGEKSGKRDDHRCDAHEVHHTMTRMKRGLLSIVVCASAACGSNPAAFSDRVGIETKVKSGDVGAGSALSTSKDINTESGNPYGQ